MAGEEGLLGGEGALARLRAAIVVQARRIDPFQGLAAALPVAIIAACALLFIATLLLGALVNYLIGELIRVTGLSGTDRFLGMVFGGARGVLLVVLLVGLLSLAPVQQDPWWQQSVLMPHFLMVADWSKNFILGFAGQWLPAAPITPPSGIGGLLPSQ
ncbi:CvpA family protein [Pseudomonas aeruginosa]|uniref:CvpA family protein n=1 Tax=Pseudomonas aeruginosa TaxID=287 RepID=UPI001E4F94A3|nr:CvpA family protein [Pseudomonas aeruginosa]